jgi:hypothetical protein
MGEDTDVFKPTLRLSPTAGFVPARVLGGVVVITGRVV